MKTPLAVILALVVLIQQGNCLTDLELVDAGLWTDTMNGVASAQQLPEMSDICRFLLHGNEIGMGFLLVMKLKLWIVSSKPSNPTALDLFSPVLHRSYASGPF